MRSTAPDVTGTLGGVTVSFFQLHDSPPNKSVPPGRWETMMEMRFQTSREANSLLEDRGSPDARAHILHDLQHLQS